MWSDQADQTPGADLWVEVPDTVLREVERQYEQGQMLQAWERAQRCGPLQAWQGVRAVQWAGRLAVQLGGRRLSHVLHWRNWRRHGRDAGAMAYYLQTLLERRGPLRALEFLEQSPPPGPESEADGLMYLSALQAQVAWEFRDFESAGRHLAQARAVAPGHRWLAIAEAGLLEKQDRYEAALEVVRQSLAGNPLYRPALQVVAHLLQVLGQAEEALAFLQAGAERMQSGPVFGQLAVLEMDLEHFAEALSHFDRLLELSPLADKHLLSWLQRNRIATACRMGDLDRARLWTAQVSEPYYRDLAQRLAQPDPPRRRVQLPVAFVRQHHMTCGPATLTALSRYWGRAAEHLDVAERICYDGTPLHSERRWAERAGFVAREFTVTWEAAVGLLDRGLPFTLTTTEVNSGHLQAVIGYDELRRCLLLRDPFLYSTPEALCPDFLAHYAATGPRGMTVVPKEQSARLQDLPLPDADLYDQLHGLDCALESHQREAAVGFLRAMEHAAPGHRLTLTAGRALAAYDANRAALLRYVNALLELFPRDNQLKLAKVSCLADQASRLERIAFLEETCQQPGADPLFFSQLAAELREDGRQRVRARTLARWALRFRPADPDFLKSYADVLWDEREWERAARLYRLAACLADRKEPFARAYFLGARFLRRGEEALAFLRRRWEVSGRQSAEPACTLFEAFVQMDRVQEGLTLLQEAMQRRPQDGDLLLFAAEACGRFGAFAQAEGYLQQARGRTRQANWLRSAATLAVYQCDRKGALAQWREVLALEPLALDANRAVAQLLAETEGRAAAHRFLDDVCGRFSAHCGLLAARAEFLRAAGPQAVEPALRQLWAANPADAWALRELALQLGQLNRLEEALRLAEQAITLDPTSPYGFCARGDVLLRLGRRGQAKCDFQRALEWAVDTGYAMERLVETCDTDPQRREALRFIEDQLVRQVVFGHGLMVYRNVARGVLGPDAVLARLQEARQARPDLWAAWSMEINQLADMDRLDAALALADQAVERFAFLPQLRWDRARVHHLRLALEPAMADLETALSINPAYGEAARFAAELAMRKGDLDKARQLLERATAHAPLDAFNHGCLAEILWTKGSKDEALERIEHALRLDPGYDWAWQRLREWSAHQQQPERAVRLARDLADRRPGEPRSWLLLAECLMEIEPPEALRAADRAVALDPRLPEGYDLKARLLVRQDRFEEALACCRPPALEPRPAELQIREAWIEAERGRLSLAIQQMEAALATHSTYYGGWQLLSDWYAQTSDWKRATEAADRMAALAPQNPVPLGYAAELCLKQGDRSGAMNRFRRAFQLDPAYPFAGLSLFDLLLEDGDTAGAEEVLAALQRHAEWEYVAAREVRLAMRQGRTQAALETFETLGRRSTREAWCLLAAAQSLDGARLARKVDQLVHQLLGEASPNTWLGALYVTRRFNRGRFRPTGLLHRIFRRGDLGRNALVTYLDKLAERYHQAQTQGQAHLLPYLRSYFRRVLRRHHDLLQADDLAWGKVGYVLATLGDYKRVVHWLRDWPTRRDVEPWMLYNLALGLELTGQPGPALEILRRGLSLRQAPDLFASFAALAGFEEIMQGNPAAARELVSSVPADQLPAIDKAILGLARALLLPLDVPDADQRKLGRKVRALIKEAFSRTQPCRHHAIVRRCFWRCLNRLASAHRLPGLRFWGWWSYLDPRGWGRLA